MFPQRINKDIVTDLINRMYTSDHCGPVISKISSCNILRISGSRFGVIHPLGNLKQNKVEITDKSHKYGEIWYYKLLKNARDLFYVCAIFLLNYKMSNSIFAVSDSKKTLCSE